MAGLDADYVASLMHPGLARQAGLAEMLAQKANHPKSLNKDEVLYRSHRYNF